MQLCVCVMRKMKILVVQSVQLTSRPSSSFTTLCRGQVQTSNLEEEGRGGGGGAGRGGDRGVNLVPGYPTQSTACVWKNGTRNLDLR